MLRSEILISGEYSSIPHCVWESALLRPTDKLVYLCLLDHLGNNDDSWPCLATITKRTKLSDRGVRYAIERLVEVGLISRTVENADSRRRSGDVNHYVFNHPKEALEAAKTLAKRANLSDSDNPAEVGTPCRIPTEEVGTACQINLAKRAGEGGKACRIMPDTPARRANEPLKTFNHVKETTSVEPRHSTPPPAAARETDTTPSPAQVPGWRQLLAVWKKQKRSLPSPAKLKTCQRLLAIQQEQTGELLDASAIEPGVPLDFPNLFKRQHTGRYYWQELSVIKSNLADGQTAKSLHQMKRVLDKLGSAAQIEEIYELYPRKIGRASALKAIKDAIKRMHERDKNADAVGFLLERTKLFAASAAGNNGKWTPYPVNWFRDERYLDNEAEWGVVENRSGNLKREITEIEDEEPGETFEDFINRKNKEKT